MRVVLPAVTSPSKRRFADDTLLTAGGAPLLTSASAAAFAFAQTLAGCENPFPLFSRDVSRQSPSDTWLS